MTKLAHFKYYHSAFTVFKSSVKNNKSLKKKTTQWEMINNVLKRNSGQSINI